jgi:carboxyl-terminal processing protease
MKTSPFTHSGFIILLMVVSAAATAQKADNVFDYIGPCYELSEFIARSEFVQKHEEVYSQLEPAFAEAGVPLRLVSSKSGPQKLIRFENSDKSIWLEIHQGSNGNDLYDLWKSTLKGKGYKADIRNDAGGSVFMKTKTTSNSAVGALCFTGRNLISLEIQLPFAVPDTYNQLDSASRNYIHKQYAIVYKILLAIAETYIVPAELILYKKPGERLTEEQRLYGFIQFWTEVKYNFAFFDQVPELNWDRVLADYLPLIQKDQPDVEYYRTMKKMCALLKDGHTNFFAPSSIESGIDSPPVRLLNVGGKAIVENVSVELADNLPIGSEIISVDATPVQQYLQENLYPYISSSTDHIRTDWAIRDLLRGPKESSVGIVVKSVSGKEKTITLQRNSTGEMIKKRTPWKLFVFKKLPDNVAYVALNSFGDEDIVKEFEARIDSINQCKALVIDLRGNGGGSSTNGYDILEHFTNKPFLTSAWRTREHKPAYKAWGSFRATGYRNISKRKEGDLSAWDEEMIQAYKGETWYRASADKITPRSNKKIKVPFVVLTGHNTASAAEDFLVALDNLHIAKTVGSKTFGSTGQPLMIDLPGGASARICTKRDEYPDGRQFVGFGVQPDVYIENTVEDLINGTDSTLKKGVEIVLKKK